jgi:methionyl-tRNA formyltransferase
MVPNLEASAAAVAAAKPDLLVSWFWTKRIPASVLAIPKLGAFGVHPSLLPRHRGPDPTFWAIDAGDTETGVTAHVLDASYDTGPVLGRATLAIAPEWNAWTLAKKLDRPSLALLRATVAAFARGAPPRAVPQDEAYATEAPTPDDAMLEIRWNAPADGIVRRIRAASPWPGAFTDIGGKVVTITRGRVATDVPRALAPGEACVHRGVAVVRAGDHGVALLEGRTDEDERELDTDALARFVAEISGP